MTRDESSEFLSVTFTIKMETHISMEKGETIEEKLENWKKHAEEALTDDIRHWGEINYNIDLVEAKIVEHKEGEF